MTTTGAECEYDFIIVGSGFGGSVSALRLVEKGYRVAVIEQGKRWSASDFPETNLRVRRYLWAPRALCHGIMQMSFFKHLIAIHGIGVGGGSLVYANTLLEPPDAFYRDPKWADLKDWKAALAPHYETAKRMLGRVETPHLGPADEVLREIARDMGREATFYRQQVGVFFGEPGVTVKDPYFGGEGPDRAGCILCGGCMVGCRHNAKNSLDKNYLYFAEKKGATVIPEARATDVRPRAGGGYEVDTRRSTSLLGRPRRTYTAKGVVFAAGVLGTVPLLLRCKARGSLPRLSGALGTYVRTNSEAFTMVTVPARAAADYSKGIAISAGFHPDDQSHIEVVRYNEGSDFMKLLTTTLTPGGPPWPRLLRWLFAILASPIRFLRLLWPFGWAKRTAIFMCMQPLDNSIELRLRRRWWWPFSRVVDTDLCDRPRIPTYIPAVNEVAERYQRKTGGLPQSVLPEVVLDLSSTAHILGGCPIGRSPEDGVVDAACRVFGYDDLYVVDGSMISANLGVNPSLTITALAEHAMAQVPAKADAAAGAPAAR